MVNKFFLFILFLPEKLYEKLGVNTNQLKAIVSTKLLMDNRRPNSIQYAQQKKSGKPIQSATRGIMMLSFFMGIFFITPFMLINNSLTQFTIFFSLYIFFLASTLITDFTSVLIDIRDNAIILPKPISDKTFLLARLLHIIIHVSKIMIPMALPSLIVIGIKYGMIGLFAILFLLPLATLFSIFIINTVYILILKITTPEKFKSIISYFQIIFTIIIYASYQLVPRLMSKTILENYTIPKTTIYLIAPPYWFAGSWEFLYTQSFSYNLLVAFFLSIIMPILSIWIVIKYFAPNFNQKLAMISGSEMAERKISISPTITSKNKLIKRIAIFLTKNGTERMGFMLTWFMTSRSRDFKMRLYPSIGYLIVYFGIMFINSKKISLQDFKNQTNAGKLIFVTAIYFISFVIMQAIHFLRFSEKEKASWIYFTSPISQPGNIISGAVKAIILKFYIPLALMISMLGIAFIGIGIIPNLLLGLVNQVCICFLIAYISLNELPFSRTEPIANKGGNFIRGLFSLLIPFGMATVHFFVYNFMPVIFILLALSMVATWLVSEAVYNRGWKDLATAK